MSEEIRDKVEQTIREAIAAGMTADEIETILDEQRDRLDAVRAFEEGEA